jgi:hypothetical protein
MTLYAQGKSFDDEVINSVESAQGIQENILEDTYRQAEPKNSIEEEEKQLNWQYMNDDHRYDSYESDDDYGDDYDNDTYQDDDWFSEY